MPIQATGVTYTTTDLDLLKVLSTTKFVIDPEKIQPHEIIVKTLATPINPSDLVQIKGVYPSPPRKQRLSNVDASEEVAVGGNEGAFEIIAVGASVDGYKVGDWVIPTLPSFGTWRSHAVVSTKEDKHPFIIVKSGNNTSISKFEAATISVNPSTAVQLIDNYIKDWGTNDWIITNAGNSLVNQFLVQIAKARNIKTILVIRDGKPDELYQLLKSLGATVVVSESEFLAPSFIKSLPKLTNDGNVKLALNSVGGPTVPQLVESLTFNGFLVTYGTSGGHTTVEYSLTTQLFKNITTVSYWLTRNTKNDPQSKITTIDKVLEYYNKGQIQPVKYEENEAGSDDLKGVYLKAIEKDGKQIIVY